MLADKELEQTAAQLADFRTASEHHHATLSEVLQKYNALVDDYRRLRSDYEEERDSRERYKQMARGQERNPFVLVLIDGDGYVFDDDMVSKGTEGGQQAARLLNEAVKNSLRSRGLDHCRIMVRVYANLAGLSKALSKAKLAGPEKRSLAPFTANFTRSNDLFDFVDAGELKENADFKIRAMFRQFAENAQCRHIYFAGCHDVGYLSELTPYVGNRDRITLVRTPAFHHEYTKLGMRVEDFPNIFRTMPLEGQPTVSIKPAATRAVEPPTAPAADSSPQICPFFPKGICKYGRGCRYLHVKSHVNGTSSASANPGSLSDIREWRQSSGAKYTLPFQMPNLSKIDNDFMSGNGVATDPAQLQVDFATWLPQAESVPRDEIPINRHNHRLDSYIAPVSAEDRIAFQARIAKHKLCNNHHIHGNCPNGDNCDYDHGPITPALLACLKRVTRNQPCPRKGACRSLSCMNGHICQKAECKFRGGRVFCKFGPGTHNADLHLAEFVPGIAAQRDGMEGSEAGASVSEKGSSPPTTQEARSVLNDSDGDCEEHEGAEEGALLEFGDDSSND